MSGIRPKLDIFDAHNFELDINVDGIQVNRIYSKGVVQLILIVTFLHKE